MSNDNETPHVLRCACGTEFRTRVIVGLPEGLSMETMAGRLAQHNGWRQSGHEWSCPDHLPTTKEQ